MADIEDVITDTTMYCITPIYVIMCVVLIFFSLTTLTIIIKDYRLRNTSSPLFIANLALVDLCLAVFTAFGIFIFILNKELKLWALAETQGTVYVLIMTLSLLSTFANTIDRYIYIRYSLQYHRIMTVSRTKWIILSIWTFSILFSVIPTIYNMVCGDRNYIYPPFPASRIYGNYLPLWIMYCLTNLTSKIIFGILFIIVRKRRHSVVTSRIPSLLMSPSPPHNSPNTSIKSPDSDSNTTVQIRRSSESFSAFPNLLNDDRNHSDVDTENCETEVERSETCARLLDVHEEEEDSTIERRMYQNGWNNGKNCTRTEIDDGVFESNTNTTFLESSNLNAEANGDSRSEKTSPYSYKDKAGLKTSNSDCVATEVIRSLTPRVKAKELSWCCYDTDDVKTAKTLFTLLNVYIILWCPTYILLFLLSILDMDIHRYFMWAYFLAILNSIIDFFVYPMRIERIRETFVDACKRFRNSCRCNR